MEFGKKEALKIFPNKNNGIPKKIGIQNKAFKNFSEELSSHSEKIPKSI